MVSGFPKLTRSRYALDVDEPWEHAPTQFMTLFNTTTATATATATALEVDSRPNPHVLNWGSDTCFQSKANYTVTDHQLNDEDRLTRLLVNHSWVTLHYSHACGQKRPQQQEEKQEELRSRRHRTSSRDTPVGPATQQVRKKSRQPSHKRHAAHIRSEQVRRDLVKQRFAELKLLVPRLRGQNFPKSEILQIVGDWIQELLKGNVALEAQLAEMDKLSYILVPWDEDPD
ncbi:uncharacterized protein BDV14DRAFT_194375 [Aspergillus stella-maris]|uniref:uncharacterized protein n=1 Tax=Aspergillus stella-maris TaxID=1810926 RepID=UPI003CCCCA60